ALVLDLTVRMHRNVVVHVQLPKPVILFNLKDKLRDSRELVDNRLYFRKVRTTRVDKNTIGVVLNNAKSRYLGEQLITYCNKYHLSDTTCLRAHIVVIESKPLVTHRAIRRVQ